LSTLGARDHRFCINSSLVWWISDERVGKYMSCDIMYDKDGIAVGTPPKHGWRARWQPGWNWSEAYSTQHMPRIRVAKPAYVKPDVLVVKKAGYKVVDGKFLRVGMNWVGSWPGGGRTYISLSEELVEEYCGKHSTKIWWLFAEGYKRYYACAEPGEEGANPPLKGWKARDQSDWDWSYIYKNRSQPQLFVFTGNDTSFEQEEEAYHRREKEKERKHAAKLKKMYEQKVAAEKAEKDEELAKLKKAEEAAVNASDKEKAEDAKADRVAAAKKKNDGLAWRL